MVAQLPAAPRALAVLLMTLFQLGEPSRGCLVAEGAVSSGEEVPSPSPSQAAAWTLER